MARRIVVTDPAAPPADGEILVYDAAADAVTSSFAYEVGTWTPVVTFVTPGDLSVVYTRQVGRYIKIGRLVYCLIDISCSTFTHTTASGELRVTGLPFTSQQLAGTYASPISCRVSTEPTNAIGYTAAVLSNSTSMNVQAMRTSNAPTPLTTANFITAIDPNLRSVFVYNTAS